MHDPLHLSSQWAPEHLAITCGGHTLLPFLIGIGLTYLPKYGKDLIRSGGPGDLYT